MVDREREVVRERPAEREVVVDDRPPRGGGGGGGLIAAIIGVILVLIIGWFLLNALGIMGEAADNAGESGDVNVEVPEDINADVDVNDGEGG